MAVSPSSLYTYPSKSLSWNERDVLLFANSIGCEPEDGLHYLYELHPKFSVFPTYPIVLTFKHDYTSTASFKQHFTKHLTPPEGFIPGFPRLDIGRVVDGERTLEVVHPLPASSGNRDFTIQSHVIGVWDKGKDKPTIVQTEHHVLERSKTGTGIAGKREDFLYARMTETAIFMDQGGWGGPNGPPPAASAAAPSEAPSTSPTHVATHSIPRTAHLLYRLNGDYNPLHATHSSSAASNIQPTPIMHGLYSWNEAAQQILKQFANNDPTALKSFRAKFAAPVRPGDELDMEFWEGKGETDGEKEVKFRILVKGKVVLDRGVAVLRVRGKGRREGKL